MIATEHWRALAWHRAPYRSDCAWKRVCGAVRAADASPRGWGWALETVTAIIATLIVLWFIAVDVKTMRESVRIGYPRSMFLKGIACNALIVWYWAHTIVQGGGFNLHALIDEAGLTFNTIAGNLVYLLYYLAFEYYKAREREWMTVESELCNRMNLPK